MAPEPSAFAVLMALITVMGGALRGQGVAAFLERSMIDTSASPYFVVCSVVMSLRQCSLASEIPKGNPLEIPVCTASANFVGGFGVV